jgi:hypothetical protein
MQSAQCHPSRIRETRWRVLPVEPKVCPSATSARALSARLAQAHVGVIAWSRTGDPDLDDWGAPEVMVRTGVIPDELEQAGRFDFHYKPPAVLACDRCHLPRMSVVFSSASKDARRGLASTMPLPSRPGANPGQQFGCLDAVASCNPALRR